MLGADVEEEAAAAAVGGGGGDNGQPRHGSSGVAAAASRVISPLPASGKASLTDEGAAAGAPSELAALGGCRQTNRAMCRCWSWDATRWVLRRARFSGRCGACTRSRYAVATRQRPRCSRRRDGGCARAWCGIESIAETRITELAVQRPTG